jgi:hypothetical protein
MRSASQQPFQSQNWKFGCDNLLEAWVILIVKSLLWKNVSVSRKLQTLVRSMINFCIIKLGEYSSFFQKCELTIAKFWDEYYGPEGKEDKDLGIEGSFEKKEAFLRRW